MTGLAAHDWLESDQQASDRAAAGRPAINRQAVDRQAAPASPAPDWHGPDRQGPDRQGPDRQGPDRQRSEQQAAAGVQAPDWQGPDPQGPDPQGPHQQAAAGVQAPDWQPQPDGAARPDERQSQYVPVECQECGAVVLAAKFSVQHTSVQWDAVAVRQCAEFARRAAVGEQTPLIERCNAIRASIEGAALEGRLPVTPP
jgi:hypothetical protein